jgi:hypothetical protein
MQSSTKWVTEATVIIQMPAGMHIQLDYPMIKKHDRRFGRSFQIDPNRMVKMRSPTALFYDILWKPLVPRFPKPSAKGILGMSILMFRDVSAPTGGYLVAFLQEYARIELVCHGISGYQPAKTSYPPVFQLR